MMRTLFTNKMWVLTSAQCLRSAEAWRLLCTGRRGRGWAGLGCRGCYHVLPRGQPGCSRQQAQGGQTASFPITVTQQRLLLGTWSVAAGLRWRRPGATLETRLAGKWGARGLPCLVGRGGCCGHRTATTTEDSLVFVVHSTELEKPCSTGVVFSCR